MNTNQDYYEFGRSEVPVDGWEQYVVDDLESRTDADEVHAVAKCDGEVFSFIFPDSEELALSGERDVFIGRFSADNGDSVEEEQFDEPFNLVDRYVGERTRYENIVCAVGFWVKCGLKVADLPDWVLKGAKVDAFLRLDAKQLHLQDGREFEECHLLGVVALRDYKREDAARAYAVPANDTSRRAA